MLAIINFRIAGDKGYQLESPEMLATNASNYKFQKCWRFILAIIMFRNAGDKMLANIILRNAGNNNYNGWARGPGTTGELPPNQGTK